MERRDKESPLTITHETKEKKKPALWEANQLRYLSKARLLAESN